MFRRFFSARLLLTPSQTVLPSRTRSSNEYSSGSDFRSHLDSTSRSGWAWSLLYVDILRERGRPRHTVEFTGAPPRMGAITLAVPSIWLGGSAPGRPRP